MTDLRSNQTAPVGATLPGTELQHPHAQLPTVSVIIPTYNRADMVRDTLVCLLAQDYPADRLEIIVVDEASADNTGAVVQELAARSPFPLRYLRHEKARGPAAARNTGIRNATGEILGFTDSDCRPSTLWVRKSVEAFAPGVGLVSGPIRPVFNPERPVGRFFHQIDETSQENPRYPTANAFYRARLVRDLGGFDERLRVSEDTDLAWRVRRAGYATAFAPEATVDHEASPTSFLKWLKEPFTAAVLPSIVAKYPELRDLLLWRHYFVYRYTPAFYLALGGLLVGAITKFPPAFAAPLVLIYMMRGLAWKHQHNPAEWWKIVAKYFIHISRLGMTICALWYGSARFKALVI